MHGGDDMKGVNNEIEGHFERPRRGRTKLLAAKSIGDKECGVCCPVLGV